MAWPKPLALVRDQEEISASMQLELPIHARSISATSLLEAIQAAAGYTVTRKTAVQVPAYVRAEKIYTHTISAFPLREFVGPTEIVARPFLQQPSRNTTYAAEIMRLVSDLLNYDKAWWRVTERTWDGFPAGIVRMPANEITETDEAVYWNGTIVPIRDVIRFDGDGTGGWLTVGAAAINTAAALEAAVMRYAEYPLPTVVLKNTGADLPATAVDHLLEAWEEARTTRSTAYLNSTLNTETIGWNASDLQLVEARNAAAVQIARLANLDPIWTGSGVPGASLTYQNRVDLYRQLLDTALTPVMNLIQQRLSMNDVTPRGHTVRFDTTTFLRQNPSDIAQLIATLRPLDVITVDEARALLDLPALGVIDPPSTPAVRSL